MKQSLEQIQLIYMEKNLLFEITANEFKIPILRIYQSLQKFKKKNSNNEGHTIKYNKINYT